MAIYKILFGCVAFNNPDDIGSWLTGLSIFMISDGLNAAICDNSTNQEHSRYIHQIADSKSASYYREPSNPGYFAGLNRILAENPGYDYYVLGNSDIAYDEQFVEMLRNLREADDVAVIAPRIENHSGAELNPYIMCRPNRFEETVDRIKYWGLPFYIAYAVLCKLKIVHAMISLFGNQKYWQKNKTNEIWAAHGSCFVLTKAFMKKCGALPAVTFLWFEESLLAVLVERKNLKIVYEIQLLVRHTGRATTNKLSYYLRYKIKKASFQRYLRYLGDS